jgi:hypothetical protein
MKVRNIEGVGSAIEVIALGELHTGAGTVQSVLTVTYFRNFTI